jgi:hypothetical protein
MSLLSTTPAPLSKFARRYPSFLRAARQALAQFRRKFLPTDAELDLEYLNASADLRDLEYRIRRLDHLRARSRGGLYYRR